MADEFQYDAFRSHASVDKATVRELAERPSELPATHAPVFFTGAV